MAAPRVDRESFGTTAGGAEVEQITLDDGAGMRVQLLTWGAVVRTLSVPDAEGRSEDVVLGYDTLREYEADRFYLGAVIGRYANRVRGGRFELDGQEHRLPLNEGPNHMHGGPGGFHRQVWSVREVTGDSVGLSYPSREGEEGYPGRLEMRVTYTVTGRNELVVQYLATADRATPVNPTQHSYFNLAGPGKGDVLDHEVTLQADHFTATDESSIPLGGVQPVAGTPLDFTTPRPMGERADADHPQLRIAGGYDHNYVIRGWDGDLRSAALVREPTTGRTLEVLTTEPGLQLYGGNNLEEAVGKGGVRFGPCYGLCLETQHFPDSPNHPEYPSTILRPGETFRSRTVFRFGVA